MCSTLSSWRLYSWMRLIWQSKIVSGSTMLPVLALSQSANAALASRLACAELGAEAGVVGQRQQLAQLVQVRDPAVADRLGDERGQDGLASCSQRRGVTPLVLLLKRSGNISAKSRSTRVAQQFRVDCGHAVGAVRADDRQVAPCARLRVGPSSIRLMRCDARLVAGIALRAHRRGIGG